jgi:hypothetical protein
MKGNVSKLGLANAYHYLDLNLLTYRLVSKILKDTTLWCNELQNFLLHKGTMFKFYLIKVILKHIYGTTQNSTNYKSQDTPRIITINMIIIQS